MRPFRFLVCALCVFLFGSVFLAGCAGVSHEAYYKGDAGQITADMTPYKDEILKLDFMVPAGWTEVPWADDLPDSLKLRRDITTETGGMAVFRKGDKGSVMVWCRTSSQTPHYMRREMVDRLAPENQIVKGALQISAEGWNPVFYRYDASFIVKGEKQGFSVFAGEKEQALLSLYGCMYGALGRSTSLDYSDEIESDFISILRSLKN